MNAMIWMRGYAITTNIHKYLKNVLFIHLGFKRDPARQMDLYTIYILSLLSWECRYFRL